MTTAEKLTQIAKNVPKVYEAGFEAGKAEGGAVEFEDVSLTALDEAGKFDFVTTNEGEGYSVSEKGISFMGGTFTMSLTGYVEFSIDLCTSGHEIIVDGVTVTKTDYGTETVEFAGEVKEGIVINGNLFTGTFSNFVIRKDYDKGYADGVQSEYDRFWDKYQENGARTNYQFAFGGNGWTDETFKPKYDIIMKGNINYAFANCKITDLISALSESGVSFDCNGATNIQSLFQYSTLLTRVPAIDASALTSNLNMVFYGCTALTYIEKIVVSEKTQFKDNTFGNCTSLTDITFEGTIAQNGLNLQWSPLTHDSIMGVITALADKSEDTSGTVWEVIIGETNKAKLTEDEIKIAQDKGWTLG